MKHPKIVQTVLFFCLSVQCTAQVDAYQYQAQKKVTVANGAVVSAHPLASKVGLQILKSSGNAVDAAIATQLALAGWISDYYVLDKYFHCWFRGMHTLLCNELL